MNGHTPSCDPEYLTSYIAQQEAAWAELAKTEQREDRIQSAAQLADLYHDVPTDFERFVALVYRRLGYSTELTPPSNDGGYDILLTKPTQSGKSASILVECKCFGRKNLVGRPLLQKLKGADATVHADGLAFVTTSSFSKSAREYAEAAGIELIDGKGLLRLAKDAGVTLRDAEKLKRLRP